MANSTQNPTQHQHATLVAQKQVIGSGKGTSSDILATNIEHFLNEYEHLAKEDKIRKFLRKTKLYKRGVWEMPREEGTVEADSYGPMNTIVNEIIPFFHSSPDRKAFVTSGKPLYHEDPVTDHSLSPDLVI